MPDLSYEKKHSKKFQYVVGVDEVGRGPWAGPVVACACLIPEGLELPSEITDSKKLTAKKRQVLSEFLVKNIPYSIAEASAGEVDELNILQATFVAMNRAVEALKERLSISDDEFFVLVDGNRLPQFDNFKNAESIIKGDSISLTISCSSIIAKVYRDKFMADLAEDFPYYGWESNSGYGTKKHQEGLAEHGTCKFHRFSFKPIAKIVAK
ncbi:MAG: ribonuclease HII [Proteobacteria bacterium]|nr:ribonuclease HII [Pseudomonadota bacterium]